MPGPPGELATTRLRSWQREMALAVGIHIPVASVQSGGPLRSPVHSRGSPAVYEFRQRTAFEIFTSALASASSSCSGVRDIRSRKKDTER
jgi:hypothetical protein